MFWKTVIPISHQMHQTSGPAMLFARYFGMFPIKVEKKGSQLFLRWSRTYALFSFMFGVITVYLTYDGFIADILIGPDRSIRLKTKQDFLTTFFDVTLVLLVLFVGVFITPFKYSTFCKYINCFNEVDAIIPPRNIKFSRNLSAFVLSSVLISIFVILVDDTFLYFGQTKGKHTKFFVFKCYTPFYVCYHAMLLSQCLFWHLVYCLLRRLKLLNDRLRNFNSSQRIFCLIPGQLQARLEKQITDRVAKGINRNQQIKEKDTNLNQNSIMKLMIVYGKLCDAVQYLNRLYGVNCTVIILGILWHLIITNYALILGIAGGNRSLRFILMMITWCIIHICRLMFLAQPCHYCLIETQETKELVCNLISSPHIDFQTRAQLQDFALVLLHRKFEFTASGLATINRSFITSIMSAITTYLVILLQFSSSGITKKCET